MGGLLITFCKLLQLLVKSFNNKKNLLEEKEALSEKVAISEYTGTLSIDINIWTHKKK